LLFLNNKERFKMKKFAVIKENEDVVFTLFGRKENLIWKRLRKNNSKNERMKDFSVKLCG